VGIPFVCFYVKLHLQRFLFKLLWSYIEWQENFTNLIHPVQLCNIQSLQTRHTILIPCSYKINDIFSKTQRSLLRQVLILFNKHLNKVSASRLEGDLKWFLIYRCISKSKCMHEKKNHSRTCCQTNHPQ
jgi:hypothetical protein